MADRKYPEGKISDTDEGELSFRVAAFEGRVIMDWGKAVKWIGMPPSAARTLAEGLMRQADEAEKQRKG